MGWNEEMDVALNDIHSDCHYEQSAEMLRVFIRKKLLKFTDLAQNPERFFMAHRMILVPDSARRRGPGFGIRFTVQYNLFAGSILGLGAPDQVALLDTFQEQGALGCFCLTEKLAGVNSGLVVNTTAEWMSDRQGFRLNCPNIGAYKNWISQGLTARRAVVIADLIIEGKAYGPHGFLVDLRDAQGKPLEGVTITDMGEKTTANDLDNASIGFTNVYVPKDALLRRFADIENNKYVQTTDQRMRIEVIGQRLLTGRLAISEAAVQFARNLYTAASDYAKHKDCWAPRGAKSPPLSDMPQLKHLFFTVERKLKAIESYTRAVEAELCDVLRTSAIPDVSLVEKIAVAKIKSVETAIDLSHRLRQEVGSFALMSGTGFECTDFLQCCKFAEGDSRILMQKLARDSFKSLKSKDSVSMGEGAAARNEQTIRASLAEALKSKNKNAWDENWQLVYALADAVCDRHFANVVGEENILSKL